MQIEDYPPSRLKAAMNAAIEYVNTLAKQNTDATVAVISFSDKAKTVPGEGSTFYFTIPVVKKG